MLKPLLRTLAFLLLLPSFHLAAQPGVSEPALYPTLTSAQPGVSSLLQPYNPVIDVQHYDFSLGLTDLDDNIEGYAIITLVFRKDAPEFSLDLTAKNSEGKGMTVTSVKEGRKKVRFTQDDQHLILHTAGVAGSTHTYKIAYKGIPADGLIIGKNKFGSRGFFGDNWPNRAHNWLPCVDDPSDKATLDFHVLAPDHYTVVANGALQEQKKLPFHLKMTHWTESEPIAPKIMVIGVADFAVDHPGDTLGVPVWNYVYSQNKEAGFHSYAVALDILPFYITHIGPFPFEKEGNVQSKTRYGGLENASAIFYNEASVGSPGVGSLMAHEIAHQWFGDAATETAWSHLWLSEGFATYMTHCYLESKYGSDTLRAGLRRDRARVISFERRRFVPVIDTTVGADYMQLLDANSYQKGGWVLHMLRRSLGDDTFWKGLSTYYTTYRNKNASSADFEKVMETVSGKDLRAFFHQWLDLPGHPHVTMSWKYDPDKKSLSIDFTQHVLAPPSLHPNTPGATATPPAAASQPNATPGPNSDSAAGNDPLFTFPLEYSVDGTLHHIDIHDRVTHVDLPLPQKPTTLIPDPNTNLLADFDVTAL